MSSNIAGIASTTKNNMVRNKWLSIATVMVTTIVFTTASFFIAMSFIAQKAVSVSETKAQVQIYFDLEAPEEEIQKLIVKVETYDGLESVEYISQEEALRLYISYYSDDPDLVDSVSAEWLPASLELRAKSLEELDGLTEYVRSEQKTNPYIEDVQYHEDIVQQLKSISRMITIGALGIIIVFSIVTLSLIFITIAFNIRSHRNEIEIMHLVGSSDAYIKLPFIFEGTFYTALGAFLAAAFLIVPWYLFMHFAIGSNLHFILTDILKELSLDFLKSFNPWFIGVFFGIHIFIGALVGFGASSVAVMKHLNLKEK
jgi:cell division transport system permease protein